jgi:hypothetical protein
LSLRLIRLEESIQQKIGKEGEEMAHTMLLGASFESHDLVPSPEDLPSSSHMGCFQEDWGWKLV